MPEIKLRATAWFFVAFKNSGYVIYSNLNFLILIWSVFYKTNSLNPIETLLFASPPPSPPTPAAPPRLVLPLGIVTWSWEYIGVKVYTETDTRVTLESKFMNCEKPNKQRNAVLRVLILS